MKLYVHVKMDTLKQHSYLLHSERNITEVHPIAQHTT